MANYLTTDTDLTSIANAIRTKGGTSASLAFPAGFVSAIGAIPTGGGSDPMHLSTGVEIVIVRGGALYTSNKLCNDISSSASNTRISVFSLNGNGDVYYHPGSSTYTISDMHPVAIPSNATKVKLTVDRALQFAANGYPVSSSGVVSSGVALVSGWNDISANTPFEMDIPTGVDAMTVAFRVDSNNANFAYGTNLRVVKIDFS